MHPAQMRVADGAVFVRDNVIEYVGPTSGLPAPAQGAQRVIDARGMLVTPGLINTHHHLFQTLTRALPAAQNAELFDWLVAQYPIWGRMGSEAVYTSAKVGLAELLLSGCTTSTDHLYLFPNDSRLEDEIRAAQELGIRFHPSRGSMSLGRSKGGLPPDHVVQDEAAILADCRRVVEAHHDPRRYSMLRIVLAPCSPFSVTAENMRDAAALARQYGVQLHTHVAETKDEEHFCLERFGERPVDYMARLGWLGPDVWWAHVVHVNSAEINLLAQTGTGVAHCPSSNMRLGSGIAPIREMREAGVKVGLAVDGSASNDSSHLAAEMRQAMLLQRVTKGASALKVMEAIELATLGGARVLGRDDIGCLAPGMAADFAAFDLSGLSYSAAAALDPVGALLLCAPPWAAYTVVNGKVVVDKGELVGVDVRQLVARQNEIARQIISG